MHVVGNVANTSVEVTSNETEAFQGESRRSGRSESTTSSPSGSVPSLTTVTAPVQVSLHEAGELTTSEKCEVYQPELDENESPEDVVSPLKDTQADADLQDDKLSIDVGTVYPTVSDTDKRHVTDITGPVPRKLADSSTESEAKVAAEPERKPRSARSAMFDSVIRNALDPRQEPKARQNLAEALKAPNVPTSRKSVPYPLTRMQLW